MMKQSWFWLAGIVALALIGLALLAGQSHRPPEHTPHIGDSFSADLAFIFNCKGKSDPPADNAIEQFIAGKGFRVLNKVRLAKEQHVDYDWMSMDIVGIDSAHRKVTFVAFPGQPGVYFAGLYSEPPTHHSTDLENALLALTEKTLGCETRQVERHENPANAKDFYDQSFDQTEGWYKEAAEMQKQAGNAP